MSQHDWNVVQELYNELIDLPPEEQERKLRERCGNDQALFDEVWSLLQAGQKASQFLKKSADTLFEQELEPGTTIGSYRLIRPLGRGGSGTVYLAWQRSETVERLVAIKVLRPGLDDEAMRERFSLEQRVLADLQHPNIARLYDAGVTTGGRPYAVMEYVDGQPIDTFCEERGLSLEQRLSLFRQVCDAVQYAHSKLVLHRDLKPSNIFVTQEDGAPPRVHLLDFGLAKLLDPDHRADLTATQERALTPHYASPEQVRGAPVSTATDVYSLGVVLYELLTGTKPLDLSDASPMSWERIIAEENPTLPSKKAASQANDDTLTHAPSALEGDLDNIVLKALRKEPTRRYESVRALADDIDCHLEDLPVEAREPTWRYRTSRFVKRNRTAVVAGLVALLFLVTGASAALWQASVAAEERDRAQEESEKNEQALAFVVDLFEAADPMAGGGLDRPIGSVLEGTTEQVAEGFRDQPEVQAQLFTTLGTIYKNLSSFDEAEASLLRAIEILANVEADPTVDKARALRELGDTYMGLNRFSEAHEHLTAALEILDASTSGVESERAATLHNIGVYHRQSDSPANAIDYFTEALELLESSDAEMLAQRAEILNSLGVTFYYTGEYEQAENTYFDALEIYNEVGARPSMYDTHANLGILYYTTDRYDDALPHIQEALDFQESTMEDTNIRYAQTLQIEGLVLRGLADRGDQSDVTFEDAERSLIRALEVMQHLFDDSHHLTATTHEALGLLYNFWGRNEIALEHRKEAYEMQLDLHPDGHWQLAEAEAGVAEALRHLGEFEDAESHALSAYQMSVNQRGTDHPRTAYTAEIIARIYSDWGREEDAAKYEAIAQEIRD